MDQLHSRRLMYLSLFKYRNHRKQAHLLLNRRVSLIHELSIFRGHFTKVWFCWSHTKYLASFHREDLTMNGNSVQSFRLLVNNTIPLLLEPQMGPGFNDLLCRQHTNLYQATSEKEGCRERRMYRLLITGSVAEQVSVYVTTYGRASPPKSQEKSQVAPITQANDTCWFATTSRQQPTGLTYTTRLPHAMSPASKRKSE